MTRLAPSRNGGTPPPPRGAAAMAPPEALRARLAAASLRSLVREAVSCPAELPLAAPLLYPARVTALFASEKTGKSTLAGAIVHALSRGCDWLDTSVACARRAPVRTLWLALDEARADVVQRLHMLDADPDHVVIFDDVRSDSELCALLTAGNFGMLVLDNLTRWSALAGLQSLGDTMQAARVMGPLARIAHVGGCAVLLIHHRKKDGGYRDSSEIAASADVLVELSAPRGRRNPRRDLEVVGRLGMHSRSVYYDVATGRFHLDETRGDVGASPPVASSPEEAILAYVRECPGATRDRIVRAVGGGKARAIEVVKRLLNEERLMTRGTGVGRDFLRYHARDG